MCILLQIICSYVAQTVKLLLRNLGIISRRDMYLQNIELTDSNEKPYLPK